MNPQDTIALKRQDALSKSSKQSEIDSLARKIRDELFSVGTPESVKALNKLGESIAELDNSLQSSVDGIQDGNKDVSQIVKNIADSYEKTASLVLKSEEKRNETFSEALGAIKSAIMSIDIPEGKELDTSRVENLLQQMIDMKAKHKEEKQEEQTEDKLDLDDFKAHDLKDDGDVQYIGFVNRDGQWYIVENDTKNNTLRYVFGKKNYKSSIKRAGSWHYSTLSEAIDAL